MSVARTVCSVVGNSCDSYQPKYRGLSVLGEVIEVLTLIYRGILVFMALFIMICMFREKSFWKQAGAVMVLIPMILRILMIK